jgi:predicted SAM-dependent methyltransferase
MMRPAANLLPRSWGLKMARIRFNAELRKHSPLLESNGLHVNLGCGTRPIFGWINIDLIRRPDVIFWDCRRGLPFEDNSVSFIFTERFLDRLEYPEESSLFLSECLRCLAPGSVIRVVVRDAGLYLRLYGASGWNALKTAWPLEEEDDHHVDVLKGKRFETKMELMNVLFCNRGECKYAYDAETLIRHLGKAGFSNCAQYRFIRT